MADTDVPTYRKNVVPWQQMPLHVAARFGDVQGVLGRLACGDDPNQSASSEGTPLHFAVRFCPQDEGNLQDDYLEIISLLVRGGASLNSRRAGSGTALHDAAGCANVVASNRLITLGADPNSKADVQHRTPLHHAVRSGDLNTVRYFISRGVLLDVIADFEPPESFALGFPDMGMTPLHIAARENLFEIASLLIASGASIDATVKDVDRKRGGVHEGGFTAFEIALDERNVLARCLARDPELTREQLLSQMPEKRRCSLQRDWEPILKLLNPSYVPASAEEEVRMIDDNRAHVRLERLIENVLRRAKQQ